MNVMSFREYTRLVKYETEELLFEAPLETGERLTDTCRVEGKVAIGRMGIMEFLTLCWPVYWASYLAMALPQFLFERMIIKQYFSLRMVSLTLKAATQVYMCGFLLRAAQYKVTCVDISALLEWMLWLLNCSRIPVSWYVPPGSEEGWCCFPRRELHLCLDCPWRSRPNCWWPKLLDLDLPLSYWCTKGHCIWINWAITYMQKR